MRMILVPALLMEAVMKKTKWCRWIQLGCLAGLLVIPLLVTRAQGADEPPPVPPGYASSSEALKAVVAGKVPLISVPKKLPEGVTSELGIEYGKAGDRSLKLDLYRHLKADRPLPLIIFIHGGGWKGGDRSDMAFYCVTFAEKGYITATISYRFSQEAIFPAAVSDAKCAVRFLRANAAKYGIDPNKIAVSGNSAGGHLSMMVGFSPDVPELDGEGGNPGVSSRVQAVIDFYGPVDMTTDFARKQKVLKDFLGGKTWEEAPDLYKKSSPITYLTKDDPPTLVIHGTVDDIVPIDQADTLAAKLKELGIPSLYDRVEGWPHTMDLAEAVNRHCQYYMDKFLGEHLPLP
jgi:acetyl esterase/lipase